MMRVNMRWLIQSRSGAIISFLSETWPFFLPSSIRIRSAWHTHTLACAFLNILSSLDLSTLV